MMLGGFAFEALGFGFDEMGRDVDTQWAEVKVAQGWDALQWMGPSKEEVEIRGVLFPEALGGLGSLDGIRQLASTGSPMPLVSLGGNIYGLFVVIGLKEDQATFNAQGLPRMDKYRLRLRRYPGSPLVGLAGSAIRLFTR